ncbi:MAG TPA: cell division protein ZapA [Acidobacteriaceae bacterium]|nr:cell division protein ZapA [Acidobacteriaceae bacterium]
MDIMQPEEKLEESAGDHERPRSPMIPPDAAPGPVSSNLVVDIYDQIYHLRGPDPVYLQQLSALVDAKMRAVAQQGTTVDSLRVAVLAALNIADELVTLRQQRDALAGNVARSIKSRTETLAEMLDAVLENNRKVG